MEAVFFAKPRENGNSIIVTIPKEVVEMLSVKEGELKQFTIKDIKRD